MRNKLKKALAIISSASLCSGILLYYPADTLKSDFNVSAAVDGEIAINETNFPDEQFRVVLTDNFDTDGNGSLSNDEIAAVTELDFRSLRNTSIENLTGIAYLTELTRLNCATCSLSTLDLSGNTKLTEVKCDSNYIARAGCDREFISEHIELRRQSA